MEKRSHAGVPMTMAMQQVTSQQGRPSLPSFAMGAGRALGGQRLGGHHHRDTVCLLGAELAPGQSDTPSQSWQ